MSRAILANITWNDKGWTWPEVHPEAGHRYVKDNPGHECLNFVSDKMNIDSPEWINGYFRWTHAPRLFQNGGLIIFCSKDTRKNEMKIVGLYGGAEIMQEQHHHNYPDFEDGSLITNIRGKPELSMRFPIYLSFKKVIITVQRPGQVGFAYLSNSEAIKILQEELSACAQSSEHQSSIAKIQNLLDYFVGKAVTLSTYDKEKEQIFKELEEDEQVTQLSKESTGEIISSFMSNNDLQDDQEPEKTIVAIYERDARLSALLKAKANFVCQVCEQPTFEATNRKNFVESHHIIPRGMKGSDDPRNIVIVCPNCHRRFDFGSEKIKIEVYRTLRKKNLFSRFDILKNKQIISERMYDEILK